MSQPKIKSHLILEPNKLFLYIQSGDGKIMEDVGIQSTLEGSFSAVSQPIFVSKYSGILLGFHLARKVLQESLVLKRGGLRMIGFNL